jgi:hypothetical protein
MITSETIVDGRGGASFELPRFLAVKKSDEDPFERGTIRVSFLTTGNW